MAQSPRPIAFILCGALAREVLAIVERHGWPVDLYGIPAIDHMYPDRIAPDVERKFQAIRRQHEHVLVVYGDCGSRGALDEFLARHNLERIDGPHCYEMYGGALFDELMAEEPGTFFLTDFLETILVACLATTLFFGGWQVPYLFPDGFHFPGGATLAVSQWTYVLLGVTSFAVKVVLFCFLFMQIRWTLPRFRYDQLMDLGWLGLFPISVVNLLVTAVVLLMIGGGF